MKYRVYFDQVNQTRWDVEAKTEEEAVKKAEKQWRENYSWPTGAHVEVDKS